MTYTIRIPADNAAHGAQIDAVQAEVQGLRSFGTNPTALHTGSFDAARLVRERPFQDLDTSITNEDRAYWAFMRPSERPSFTRQLLTDLAAMQVQISDLFAASPERPFDYFVLGSRTPGTFNLGGDLVLFRQKIEARDANALRAYGYSCTQSGYNNYSGYGERIITIALIQGDALGGGFESAYSFLARRIGAAKTEEMIHSGNIYSAEDLHSMGVVDVLVDQDCGVEAVKRYIAKNRLRHSAHSAMYQVRRRVNPVTLQELNDVVDIWVDSALRLSEQDLRKMSRIASAQDRSRQRRLDASMAIAAE
jgi:DSF synthase